jgi:hypothetical protein
MSQFVNRTDLQQMFRSVADGKTADMLPRPGPQRAGGGATVIACPMSAEQQAMQDRLVARYDAIRAGTVKPWEDNALAITTDARKLALDARLLNANATDHPGSKINTMVEHVVRIWERTAAQCGTQVIFSELGSTPTAWGYSVSQDVIDKLVQRGMPREQIASMRDADTAAKKQALFDKVRAGQVRVVLGNTRNMGIGTDVPPQLVALHHLDAPWKPAEIERREGRLRRQGNSNADVERYRYITEGSCDAYLWQALEAQAKVTAR